MAESTDLILFCKFEMLYQFHLFYYQSMQVKTACWESEYTKIWDDRVLNAKVCGAVKVTLRQANSLTELDAKC